MVKKTSIKVNCSKCDKEFYRKPSHIARVKKIFCSTGCMRIHNEFFTCLYCCKEQKSRRYRQKYCNSSCQLRYEYSQGTRNKEDVRIARQVHHEKAVEKAERYGYEKWVNARGYIELSIPGSGIVLEHRYMWIRHNEMPVPKGFVVHHINLDKTDNRIENLVLLDNRLHSQIHYAIRERDERGQFI